jgi:release factor glutamine methyltransferase
MTTIAALFKSSPLDYTETRILLQFVLAVSHAWLITHQEHPISAQQEARLRALFHQRVQGEPIAYLISTREFYGLDLQVTPNVLIPRPETELLVELALQSMPPNANILDLGTGSGAIAIAIAKTRPDAIVYAVDQSPAALTIARKNASSHQTSIHFKQSHWFDALTSMRFHTIISNPPYIAQNDPHLSQGDLRFEPRQALTDEHDGLSAISHIIQNAPQYLLNKGQLLIEHGYQQAAACRALLHHRGFTQVQSFTDLASIERVSSGVWFG